MRFKPLQISCYEKLQKHEQGSYSGGKGLHCSEVIDRRYLQTTREIN